MPEMIVILGIAALVIFGIVVGASYFDRHARIDDELKLAGIFLLIAAALGSWEWAAHYNRDVVSRNMYSVETVGTPEDRRQIIVRDEQVVDITKVARKIVDEKRCRVGVTQYETFSCGIFLMTVDEYEYEVVCRED